MNLFRAAIQCEELASSQIIQFSIPLSFVLTLNSPILIKFNWKFMFFCYGNLIEYSMMHEINIEGKNMENINESWSWKMGMKLNFMNI